MTVSSSPPLILSVGPKGRSSRRKRKRRSSGSERAASPRACRQVQCKNRSEFPYPIPLPIFKPPQPFASFQPGTGISELRGNYDWINCEFINGNLIEVHFRRNQNFRHGNSVAIPVWNGEKVDNMNFIDDGEYFRKGFYID